jgi:Protein of unknown function (DUF742)
MSTGPDDERRQPSEPTFADVMNGFSFDAGRSSRRRRWGRKRGTDFDTPEGAVAEAPAPAAMPAPPPAPVPQAPPPGQPPTAPIDLRGVPADQGGLEGAASAVRPYAWTRGRTKSGLDLAIEALVSTSQRAKDQMGLLQLEHRAVAELCEQTRSVAEVAALLSIPLGVARVVLGDMVGLNLVTVHQTASSTGNEPDLALMERVLSGLRRL